jgi:aspartyl-tRNA(Asn)/glutamyl-tRNA(Gln) amidotransferase subunit B
MAMTESEELERLRAQLPELPGARLARFQSDYGLSPYDAGLLTEERELADYYEEVVRAGAEPKPAANWIIGELRGVEQRPTPSDLARLVGAVQAGEMNRDQGKAALADLQAGRSYEEATAGKAQLSDEAALEAIVDQVIAENPGNVADVKAGKPALGPLVGKVMQKSGGRANAKLVNDLLRRRLGA